MALVIVLAILVLLDVSAVLFDRDSRDARD